MSDVKISGLFSSNPVTSFNGTELMEVVDSNGSSGGARKAEYKKVCITLTQSGTSAPTGTVHFQSIGGSGVLSYLSPGTYLFTQAGAFPSGKVPIIKKVLFGTIGGAAINGVIISRFSDNALSIGTFADNVATNGLLTNEYFEIPIFF